MAVGAVLLRIEAGAGAAAGAVSPAAHQTAARPAAEAALTPATPGNGSADATPVAARAAAEHGVDVSALTGTGPRGRVTKADVQNANAGNAANGAGAPAPAGPSVPLGAEAKPIRGPAATLVRFMDESRSIPTATSFRTLSVDALASQRAELKAAGKKLSFTHLIAWAIVRAAADDLPVMADSFAEVDGKPHRVTPAAVSLGLAVDAERKDGTRTLIVPVIHDASAMTFDQFAARLRRGGARRPRQQALTRRLPGREHHAHQPRRHRHDRLGAAADARPGHHRGHRVDRLPAGPGGRRSQAAVGPGRLEGHDDDLDV
ncbi:MAG: 2-oxo acid dehydrogenase subunit E2 [Thermoleophilaceae bacterium]